MPGNVPWPQHKIDRLRELWGDGSPGGPSAREMAEMLGYSSNAVVGKAHRLHLPPKASPIKRVPERQVRHEELRALAAEGLDKAAIAKRMGCNVRSVSATANAINVQIVGSSPRRGFQREPFQREPRLPLVERAAIAETRVRAVLPPVYVGGLKGLRCQWPMGDPRDRASFKFCGCARVVGRVYCASHMAEAYRPTQRQLEAAE